MFRFQTLFFCLKSKLFVPVGFLKVWISDRTRPVWTGFKIAVRCKLPTHNYIVRYIDKLGEWMGGWMDGRK